MTGKHVTIGSAVLAVALAAAAQAQWPSGWGVGHGAGGGLGRTEGPITVDLWPVGESTSLSVTVSGCGGVRDYRSFGTDIALGDGQAADAAAALTRLLGEARRVCSFEPRLAARVEQGFAPAFDAWLEEMAATNYTDMNMEMGVDMSMDMNAEMAAEMALDGVDMNMTTEMVECNAEDCNGM